jgi:hypothetical protein
MSSFWIIVVYLFVLGTLGAVALRCSGAGGGCAELG